MAEISNNDGLFNKKMGVNFGGTDEWYTPEEAITPLLQYIKPDSRILCPFDTAESNYVKVFGKDHEVIHSHIFEGTDFFTLDKPDVDYIISNPPYSKRTEVLRRLYDWDIPFAMMFNCNGIFDSKLRCNFAKNKGAELLFLYPRVAYIDTEGARSAPPYMSCYWCYKILPERLMFASIVEDNQLDMFDMIGGLYEDC